MPKSIYGRRGVTLAAALESLGATDTPLATDTNPLNPAEQKPEEIKAAGAAAPEPKPEGPVVGASTESTEPAAAGQGDPITTHGAATGGELAGGPGGAAEPVVKEPATEPTSEPVVVDAQTAENDRLAAEAAAAKAEQDKLQAEENLVRDLSSDGLDEAQVEQEVKLVDETEQLQASLESADAAISETEKFANIAEQSVDNGGLDGTGAAMLEASFESLHEKLGIPYSQRVVPSFESFGGVQQKMIATNQTNSNVKERLKKVMEFIKNAAAELLKRIGEIVQFLISRVGDAGKKLDKLESELNGLSEGKVLEITHYGLIKRLGVNGSVDNLAKDLRTLYDTQKYAIEIAKQRSTMGYLKKVVAGEQVQKTEVFEKMFEMPQLPGRTVKKEGTKNIVTGAMLPGDRQVTQITYDPHSLPEKMLDGLKQAMTGYKSSLETIEPPNKGNGKMKTLSVADAKVAIKAARELLKMVQETDEVSKALKQAGAEMITIGAIMEKGIFDDALVRSYMINLGRYVGEPALSLARLSSSVVRDLCIYIELSIRGHKGTAAEQLSEKKDGEQKQLPAPAAA